MGVISLFKGGVQHFGKHAYSYSQAHNWQVSVKTGKREKPAGLGLSKVQKICLLSEEELLPEVFLKSERGCQATSRYTRKFLPLSNSNYFFLYFSCVKIEKTR